MYQFLRRTFGPLLWVLLRLKVEGREHLPKTGGYVLVANHQNALDALLIGVVIPRPIIFGACSELFKIRGLGWLLRTLHQMPVDRFGGRGALDFVNGAVGVVQAGRAVGIFPEGAFSPDGRIYDVRPGAVRIALAACVPIVPVGIRYSRWGRTRVVVGRPIGVAVCATRREMRETAKPLAELVADSLSQLTGRERAHVELPPGKSKFSRFRL